MTHKGNLLAQSGWKDVQWVEDQFNMHQSLYTTLSEKVMSQIHEGICYLENAILQSSEKILNLNKK